uniref:ZT_dimer domain-containing protein n=1 Tax=Pristionchus pacificus TaxID=54126 RepID=A0A2A6BCF3_PRIPA|eukprot:PDM63555.1 hypothetical protein PRIPAC_49528 [Pristionchus pacificus]
MKLTSLFLLFGLVALSFAQFEGADLSDDHSDIAHDEPIHEDEVTSEDDHEDVAAAAEAAEHEVHPNSGETPVAHSREHHVGYGVEKPFYHHHHGHHHHHQPCKKFYSKGFSAGYERGTARGFKAGFCAGEKKGLEIGIEKGKAIGIDIGFVKGEKKGIDVGEKIGFKKGHEAGFVEGDKHGFHRGLKKGFEHGHAKGLIDGFKKGHEAGLKEGLCKCKDRVQELKDQVTEAKKKCRGRRHRKSSSSSEEKGIDGRSCAIHLARQTTVTTTDATHNRSNLEERDTDKFINNFIFYLTIVLIFANSIASYLSGSLSILSTLVDASMDLSTSTIMGICLHQAQQVDPRYPRGKERLEMIAVILNSVIMGIANVVMIVQSLQAIANDTVDPHMTLTTMIILVSGCSIKFFIMVVCYRRGNDSSKCLAMDLRNDILTGVVAILCAYLGDAYWKYSDALGAISVCSYIAISWFRNTLEHIPFMVGVSAEKEHLSRILKIAIEHDERIQKIDHIMIYHIGAKALVELHIVMDEKLPLKITHDISHPLEQKLNRLDFVQRSFVHCDYSCDGDH